MNTTAPDGDVVEVEELAQALVAAVIRPEDADRARDTIERAGPTDLAALVALVDDQQPMTIEVVVDVLAELGCPPTAIADAVAADLDDVHVLLGIDPTPPPSALQDGPRVIDLGGTPPATDGLLGTVGPDDAAEVGGRNGPDRVTGDEPDAADAVASGPDEDEADPGDVDEPRIVVIGGGDEPSQVDDPEVDASEAASTGDPVESRTDEVSDTHDSDSSTTTDRPRAMWALVSFILLVGAALALAAFLGAFG